MYTYYNDLTANYLILLRLKTVVIEGNEK